MRRKFNLWLISLGFWALLALVFTLPSLREGKPLFRVFMAEGLPWLLWGALTPFILSQVRRFPLEPGRRGRDLAAHIASGVAIGLAFGVVTATDYLIFGDPLPSTIGRPEFYIKAVIFWTPVSLIFYCATLSVGFALAFHQRLRERDLSAAQLETRLAEAQLGALRMQLQPHFLFNTLNTVAMLVRDGDAQTSVRIIARLSELLRHMLDEGHAQEVPLRTELEYVERYLEIERYRFGERLKVDIDVPDGLRDALVPNLLLQPLVENAIRHGVARRASAGQIRIHAGRSGNTLELRVSNDGATLPADFKVGAQDGIGLRNTLARLRHLYGDGASLALGSRDGWVEAVVSLPLHNTAGRGAA